MTATLIQLSGFDLLRISGPDKSRFLQGQLSCNIETLTATTSILGTYCNLKGRVISDFQAFLRDDCIYLRTRAGLAEIMQATLAKYSVFFKVELSQVQQQFRRFGVLTSQHDELLGRFFGPLPQQAGEIAAGSGAFLLRLPGSSTRYELLCQVTPDHTEPDGSLHEALSSSVDSSDSYCWERENIRAGLVQLSPAMAEQYTPQVLNYDLDGHIDFKKGCYTGQEVVARMHYRGKAKKRLYRCQATFNEQQAATLSVMGLHLPAAITEPEKLAQLFTVTGTAEEPVSGAELISMAIPAPQQNSAASAPVELLLILPCELAEEIRQTEQTQLQLQIQHGSEKVLAAPLSFSDQPEVVARDSQ